MNIVAPITACGEVTLTTVEQDENARLRAELVEARKDTEAIDWLEDNWGHISLSHHGYWRRTFGTKDESNRYSSLRSAISGIQQQLDALDAAKGGAK